MAFGCSSVHLHEPGTDALVEERAAAVVLLQREDDGAHRERHEGAQVGLSFGLELGAPIGRVVVQAFPGVAEEPPERRQEDEESRDGKDGFIASRKALKPVLPSGASGGSSVKACGD